MWEEGQRGLQWWHKCPFHILEVWHAAVSTHWRLDVFLFHCLKHWFCVVINRCWWQTSQKNTHNYSIKLFSHYLILCIPLFQGTGFTLTLDACGARNYITQNFKLFSGLLCWLPVSSETCISVLQKHHVEKLTDIKMKASSEPFVVMNP